jgi:hypothetical protein
VELQNRIVATLGRFQSVEYETLKDEVLRGVFNDAAERAFDSALIELRNRCQIANTFGLYGRWWLTSQAALPRTFSLRRRAKG